jgi:hypothetical protein
MGPSNAQISVVDDLVEVKCSVPVNGKLVTGKVNGDLIID